MRAGPACSYTGRGTGADIGPLPHRGGKAPVLIKRAAAGRGGFLIASDRFQAMTGLIGHQKTAAAGGGSLYHYRGRTAPMRKRTDTGPWSQALVKA